MAKENGIVSLTLLLCLYHLSYSHLIKPCLVCIRHLAMLALIIGSCQTQTNL